MGPLHFLYRQGEFRPIGRQAEDYFTYQTKTGGVNVFEASANLKELKAALWQGIEPCVRAKAWRTLIQYTPFHCSDEKVVLLRKRAEYREFIAMYAEERFVRQEDTVTLETIKLIKKDVLRTLPDWQLFRNKNVQAAMVRVLLIYAVRQVNKTSVELLLARNERYACANIYCFFERKISNNSTKFRSSTF